MFCASFVVESSTGKYFMQALEYKVILGSSFASFCSRHQYWEVVFASFCSRHQYWEVVDMKIAKQNLADIWEDMKWDEKSSDEMSWDEVQLWSAECGVRRVQCEVWGKCLLGVALRRGRAQVIFLDNNTATASHKARQRAWLAHGACKFLSSSTGKWFMKA